MSALAREIAVGAFVVLAGCNAIVGLDPGEPRVVGTGGAASSSTGSRDLPIASSSSSPSAVVGTGSSVMASAVASSTTSSGLPCASGAPLGATINDCGAPSCPAYQSDLQMQIAGVHHRSFQKLADGSAPTVGAPVSGDTYAVDGLALSYVGGSTGHLEWHDAPPGVSIEPICSAPMQCGKDGIRIDFDAPIQLFAANVAATFDYFLRDPQGGTLVVVVGPPPSGAGAQFFEYVSDQPIGSVELQWAEGAGWISDVYWLSCP